MLARESDIPMKSGKYAPYVKGLYQKLEKTFHPGKADYRKFNQAERRVLVRLTIKRSGELDNIEILRPSPIAKLNESAISSIRDAAPFDPFPTSWGLDRANFHLTFEVHKNGL